MLDRDAGGFRLAPARRRRCPTGRRYLPGTIDPRDDVGHAHGLGHRARRAAHRPVAPRRRALAHAPPLADRLRRRPRPAAHAALRQRPGRDAHGVRARCSTTAAARRAGSTPAPATTRRRHGAPRQRRRADAHDRPAPRLRGPRARARTTMRDGDTAFVALSWSDHGAPETYDEAYQRLVLTADYWHEWLAHGEFPDHPWRTYLQRSALTLKGLTYAPTGAMIAAATTSLPETPGGERNWDYRYSWIRDSTFMLWGLYTLGFDGEANDFFYFIADVAAERATTCRSCTASAASASSTEEMLDAPRRLRGRAAGAHRQRRLRPEAARRLGRAARLGLPAHEVARRAARVARGRSSCKQVEKAIDALARARPRHLGGARRAQALHVLEGHVLGRLRPRRAAGAPARGRTSTAERWQAAADEIHADICENGVDERGVFTPALRHRRARRLAAC